MRTNNDGRALLGVSNFGSIELHFSPLRLVAFGARSTLHHVLKSAKFIAVGSSTRSKVALGGGFILAEVLGAKARPSVISLMLVEFLRHCLSWSCLRQGPARQISAVRSICSVFRSVPSGTDRSRS